MVLGFEPPTPGLGKHSLVVDRVPAQETEPEVLAVVVVEMVEDQGAEQDTAVVPGVGWFKV